MNILVAAPNENFDIAAMKQEFNHDVNLTGDKIFFDDQKLTDAELTSIDILVGFNHNLLMKMLKNDHSHLKFIQALSVGIDYFPLDLIKKRGINLATINGVHEEPISESIIGMILGQYRQLNNYARLRKWAKLSYPVKILAGKTAVLFGTGSIGKRTAELLKVFHVKTIGVNTHGRQVDFFDKVIPITQLNQDAFEADIIINSLPLNNSTKQLFDLAMFEQFTNQPLFLNVGRGGSVNTDDLITALKKNKISAASLDVIDPEPFPNDSELWQMDNVFISPHVSATYDDFLKNSFQIFNQNLASIKNDGQFKLNQVNL